MNKTQEPFFGFEKPRGIPSVTGKMLECRYTKTKKKGLSSFISGTFRFEGTSSKDISPEKKASQERRKRYEANIVKYRILSENPMAKVQTTKEGRKFVLVREKGKIKGTAYLS